MGYCVVVTGVSFDALSFCYLAMALILFIILLDSGSSFLKPYFSIYFALGKLAAASCTAGPLYVKVPLSSSYSTWPPFVPFPVEFLTWLYTGFSLAFAISIIT